jgi:hypothetical protein
MFFRYFSLLVGISYILGEQPISPTVVHSKQYESKKVETNYNLG